MLHNFYNMSRSDLRPYIDKARQLLDKASTFISNSGYITLKFKKNLALKKALTELGFFTLNSTNHGYLVGVHQVVLFLERGIFFLRFESNSARTKNIKKGYIDCHHLDSNRLNNSAYNLRYVTPQQNLLCAHLVGAKYEGEVVTGNIEHSFEFGGGAKETAELLRLTAKRTLFALGFEEVKIPEVVSFLLDLPGKLGRQIYTHWKSNFKQLSVMV